MYGVAVAVAAATAAIKDIRRHNLCVISDVLSIIIKPAHMRMQSMCEREMMYFYFMAFARIRSGRFISFKCPTP